MRAFAAMVLMLPAAAFADWVNGPTVPGVTPIDVQAYDGGLFTVTIGGNGTNNGNAFAYQWNGVSATFVDGVDGGDFAGAAMMTPTCVIALQASTSGFVALKAFNGPGCGGGASNLSQSSSAVYTANHLRASRVGVAVATYADGMSFLRVDSLMNGGTWQARSSTGNNPLRQGFSTLAWNGADWFAFNQSASSFLNQVDAGALNQTTLVVPGGVPPSEIALFDNGATLGGFAIDSAGTQLWRAADVKVGGFSVLDGGANLTSVDYSQLNGSVNGLGFGVLAEGSTLFGPVPNPAAPGIVWVKRSAPTGMVAPVVHVSCADPSFCVLLDSAKNVFVYTNAGKPSIVPQAPLVVVPANSSANPVPVTVTDPDGDPVWLTGDGGTLANFTITVDGGLATVSFASTQCGSAGSTISLVASDGWAPNDTPATFNVAWDNPPPTLTPVEVHAGTSVSAATNVVTSCGETYSFTADGGVSVTSAGVVTAPTNICSPQSFPITASTAAADGGFLTYPVTVNVEPWGPPFDPVFNPSTYNQAAGTSVPYDAGPEHFCGPSAGTTGDLTSLMNPFPTTVFVDAGPGGVVVTSTDPCTDSSAGGSLVIGYQRTTTSPAVAGLSAIDLKSDAGTLTVTFVADAGPLDATSTYSFFADAGQGLVFGDCGLPSNATCSAQRDYENDVTVSSGATVIADGGFDAGFWSLAVPTSCNGAYQVTSTVRDRRFGGTAQQQSATVYLMATSQPGIGNVDGTVTLSCGGGHGEVTVEIDGGCGTPVIDWTAHGTLSIDGGAGGATASFSYEANQLDQLAGTLADFDVTLLTGSQQSGPTPRAALIVPDKFITLERNPNPVIANEEEASGVELILHNTAASCDVSGIGVREDLHGLSLVKDSVRVNGRKVEAHVEGGRLSIDGLSLPRDGTLHVTYLARVPLLGEARPSGTVVMVRPYPGQNVSCPLTAGGSCEFDVKAPLSGPASPRSCGCGAFPDASVLLLTLAMMLFRRRSR